MYSKKLRSYKLILKEIEQKYSILGRASSSIYLRLLHVVFLNA